MIDSLFGFLVPGAITWWAMSRQGVRLWHIVGLAFFYIGAALVICQS